MGKMVLRWGAGEEAVPVAGPEDLDEALDALLTGPAAVQPLMAFLDGEVGALGLGLGHPADAVLTFAPHDRTQPPLHSLGQPTSPENLGFVVRGFPREFDGRCRVPADTLRHAALEFVQTGQLPTCVEWESEPVPPDLAPPS